MVTVFFLVNLVLSSWEPVSQHDTKQECIRAAIVATQVAPKNTFDCRPMIVYRDDTHGSRITPRIQFRYLT